MNNSEPQDGQTVAFPAGDLTRRLLRRATAPIGVIDTRLAFRLHSRASLWLGQRMELLAILKSRYGVDQDASGTAGTAVTGTMPLQTTGGSQLDLAPVPLLTGRNGSLDAAISTASKTPPVLETQHYRVKRPNTHLEPDPSKPLSLQTVRMQPRAAGGIGGSTNSGVAIQPQHNASEKHSGVSSTPDRSALPPVRVAEANIRGAVEDKLAAGHDGATAADVLAQVSERPRTAIARQMPLPTLAPESTRNGIRGNDTPTSGGPSSLGLALQRKAEHPPPVLAGSPVRTTETVSAPLVQRAAMPMHVESAPWRDALPDHEPPLSSSPPFTGLLLQRNADHPPPVPAGSPMRTTETVSAPLVQRAAMPMHVESAPRRDALPDHEPPLSSSPPFTGLLLQRNADHPPPVLAGSPVRTTETVSAPLVQRAAMPMHVESAPRRDALPDHEPPLSSSPPFTGLLLQRNADHPPPVPAGSPVRTTETVSAPLVRRARALPVAGAPSHGAVSAEIYAAPLLPDSTAIVWRKAQPTVASGESAAPGPAPASGPTYVNGFPIMREAAAELVPTSRVPVAMQASARNGAEIAAIAEQVSRIIARQLRAERMRRGRTR